MTDTLLTPQEVEKRGQEIYNQKLKTILEKDNMGKYVVIEIESGEYFISDSLDEALTQAKTKYPNKIFHSIKVGAEGVFKASGCFREDNNNGWLFQ